MKHLSMWITNGEDKGAYKCPPGLLIDQDCENEECGNCWHRWLDTVTPSTLGDTNVTRRVCD